MADELVFTLSIKDNASAQIDAFTRKIDGIGQQAQKEFGAFRENFNKAFGDLGKPINDINSMKAALMGLAGTGAAMAVKELGKFTADSVKNFAAYEAALTSVQRTMGLSKVELDALGESLRTLALTDLKGQVLADDLAVIAEVAGSLGVAKDDLIDFTKNVAMVATATDQSMEKVATSFGKIANVFKGSLGEDAYTKIGAIGSAFDKLADDMAATVPGMLNFTNRMGGVASSMGLTVDQTAALAATLESVGLPAERGATAMNNVMLTLMKNSSSFASALSIDADTLANALKTKPVEALQMVLKAMEELGKTKGQDELLRTMEDLMGKGNGVTEVVLKMQGAQTDFATALGKSKTAFDEATRAGESFNQAAATQEASWKAISTAVDDLQKSVGQQLQPTLNTLGTWLQNAATWWAEAFRAGMISGVFDDLVNQWEELKAAFSPQNLGDLFRAIPAALINTLADLTFVGYVLPKVKAMLDGIMELIGAGQWFQGIKDQISAVGKFIETAVVGFIKPFENFGKAVSDVFAGLKKEWEAFVKTVTDSVDAVKKVVADVKGIIKEAIPGGDKGSVSIGGFEKGTVASLEAIKVANLDLIKSNQELKQEYFAVKTAFDAAYKNGGQPTQELVDSTVRLSQVMKAAGGETAGFKVLLDQLRDSTLGVDDAYEGHSLTPALQRYIQAALSAGTTTQGLTQETLSTMQAVLDADKAYQSLEKDLNQNQRAVLDVEKSMQVLKQASVNASDFEKKRIAEELKGLQVKRSELMIEKKEIQSKMDLTREEIDMGKDVIKVFEDQQKAAEDAAKARIKAEENLQENTQRTAELRKQQQQEEMKAANDLYREQQKQAADSLKWLDQLDDATKKRIMGEKDAVQVLKEQGVTLTTLQEQELRRMQGAYKTEAAYEAQAKALQSQLSPMSALMAAGDKLSNSLGGLSSGIGKVGNLFNIDTSGITGALNKVQEFAQLPQMFDEIKNSFSGIKDAFSQLKGLDLKSIFSGGGGGISGLISSLSGIGSVAGIIMAAWTPLKNFFKGLFEDTKSQGTEAANAFQDFVSKNVSGGAEMAGAMKESFDQMTAANFDYQTFLQQTGSTMSQVMGGLSQNWQQGSTAMDIFTQAVARSGVEISKAPQVALQMTAAMDAMGLSSEQAAEKMVEVATKAGMSTEEIEKLKAALEQTSTTTQETSQSLQGLSSSSVVASMGNMDDAVKRLQMRLVELGASENEILSRTNQFKESFGQNKIDDFVKTSEIAEALSQVVEGYRNAEGQIVDLTSSQYKAVSDLFQKLASDQQLTVDEIQTYRNKLVEIGIPITELDQKLLALGITQDQINAAMASVSMATYNAENEKAIEITNRLNSEAQQRIALWQNMGLSTDEINIKLQELGLTTEQILNTAFASTNPIVGALASAFDDLSGNAALSADAHTQLANSLAQVTADGQVTSAEIGSFVSQLQSAGVPVVELSNNLLQLAQNAGMTPAQIQALSSALSEATGSVAALDNELVGHSLVPSLQLLSEAANASQTPLMGVASAAITAADGTKTASTEVDTLQAALAAGGEEGASTTEVFDAATQAAETLAETTQSLTSDVSGLTSQLSGAGAEGGDTAAIFKTASSAASELSGRTDQLSGQVRDLTNQMGSAGSSTIEASNMFSTAGGSANNLSGNMDSLAAMARAAGVDIDTLKRMLEALPAKKDIQINVATTGAVPAMASGGIVQSGLAIVNERGSEIAKFPGGSMALMTARGATLSAFPVGTEIIPHNKSMQIMRENPYIPRMATGGTITAGTPVTNNYYQYTVNLHAPVIDRNTARVIDAELQKLSKQRIGV